MKAKVLPPGQYTNSVSARYYRVIFLHCMVLVHGAEKPRYCMHEHTHKLPSARYYGFIHVPDPDSAESP